MNLSTSPLPESWIEKLFTQFSLMYGERFTAMWHGIDTALVKIKWAQSLGGYTGDQLKAALKDCEKLPFPPTLPAFKNLCDAHKPSTEPMHQRYLTKLHDKNIEEGMKRIAEMRDILARNKKVEA